MLDTPASSKRIIPWTRVFTYGIVIIGTILNLLFIIPNGDYSCVKGICGIRIGEWHYHDALWHIAVARNSFHSFPLVFPSAAGYALTSYNYLLGAIIFLLEKVWVNPFFSYFKLLPVLGNIALVYSLFRYYRLTKKSEMEQLWITFFMYLGSSFSFLLMFYRNDFAGYSILKAFPVVATIQPAFVLSNIQFFLTLPIIIFVFTDVFIQGKTKYPTLIHCILLAISVGMKMYSGVFVFLLVVIGSVRRNWTARKHSRSFFEAFIYSGILICTVLVFYLPFNTQSKGVPFIWSPLSIPHVLTESSGLFYHKEFTLGRYFMYGLHKLSLRLITYETLSIVLFLILNLGSRIFVFAYVLYESIHRHFKFENILLLTLGLLGMSIPVLYVQNGGGWYNTIQFAYIGIYFLGIVAGIYMAKIWNTRSVAIKLFAILIMLSTLPNNVLMFRLLAMEKIVIPTPEIDALEFLRKQPRGVVLSFPDDKNSSYVPAISGKVGYMIDYEQARLINLPEILIDKRINDVEKRKCSVLEEVNYLYLNSERGEEYTLCPDFNVNFNRIYIKDPIYIYQKER